MVLFYIWLICSSIAGAVIILTETWDYCHPKPGTTPKSVTVTDVLIGVVTALLPVFNVVVCIAGLAYFFTIVLPELRE